MCGHCQARIQECAKWREVEKEVRHIELVTTAEELEYVQNMMQRADRHYSRAWRQYGPTGTISQGHPISQETLRGYYHTLLISSVKGMEYLSSMAGGKYISSLGGKLVVRGLGKRKVLEFVDFKHTSLTEIDVSVSRSVFSSAADFWR